MNSIAAYYVFVANDRVNDDRDRQQHSAARPGLVTRLVSAVASVIRPARRASLPA